MLEKLDRGIGSVMYRLYRDATCYDIRTQHQVKDLSLLNRPLTQTLLMDVDPRNYEPTQPENVLKVPEWEGDPNDTYLLDILPFLETLAISGVQDVRPILQLYKDTDVPKQYAANMLRVQQMERESNPHATTQESNNNTSAHTSGWMHSLQEGLATIFGFRRHRTGSPMTPGSSHDTGILERQALQYQQFIQELDRHRQSQEEDIKRAEAEQKQMMDKAGSKIYFLYSDE